MLIIGDDPHWRRFGRSLGLAGKVIFAGRATDDQVRAAYSGADFTVVPSFQEGFGLPVIESMACGTPVACSNTASLPEVAGDAAEYFAPSDVESIAAAIENVVLSEERWRELQSLGLKQAAKFDWRDCAERHISVYRGFLARDSAHSDFASRKSARKLLGTIGKASPTPSAEEQQ